MSKKKIFIIFLIIVVIVLCTYSGFKTRYANKIPIIELANGNGYILTTVDNNIIIIDGGSKENKEFINKVISEHDNLVTAWIITSPEEDKIGALASIINDNNPNIKINNLLHSLVYSEEWYDNLNISMDNILEMKENVNTILSGKYRENLVEMGRRALYHFDNFYVTPLEMNDTNSTDISDQRVILKVDNTFKNILMFSNISKKNAEIFIENDKDQFNCEAIFFYGENQETEKLLTNTIKPKVFFTHTEASKAENGGLVQEIW